MPNHNLDAADLAARSAAAEALAREAGALALALRRGPAAAFGVESKSALDFATEADRAVERLVIERLGARFGDGVLGEEYGIQRSAASSGADSGTADPAKGQQDSVDRLWVVDPVDGTFNFMHGMPVCGVSLAFLLYGEIEIGIIYNPDSNAMFTARRGRGAFLNGEKIAVSADPYAAPLVEIGHSNRRPLAQYLDLIGRVFAAGCEFRRFGSGALGLAAVAAGRTDGYLVAHIHSWGVLAGLLLVREAGGWTNDFLARAGRTQGTPIVACTPERSGKLIGVMGAACPV